MNRAALAASVFNEELAVMFVKNVAIVCLTLGLVSCSQPLGERDRRIYICAMDTPSINLVESIAIRFGKERRLKYFKGGERDKERFTKISSNDLYPANARPILATLKRSYWYGTLNVVLSNTAAKGAIRITYYYHTDFEESDALAFEGQIKAAGLEIKMTPEECLDEL